MLMQLVMLVGLIIPDIEVLIMVGLIIPGMEVLVILTVRKRIRSLEVLRDQVPVESSCLVVFG